MCSLTESVRLRHTGVECLPLAPSARAEAKSKSAKLFTPEAHNCSPRLIVIGMLSAMEMSSINAYSAQYIGTRDA
jgi:hypothetical protein